MAETKMAYFTITAEVVMDSARGLMLSEDPGRAYRFLRDNLIGAGDDTVIKILSGEIDLIGDSHIGIDVKPADPDDVKGYLENIRYVYAGRVRLRGLWFRPCAFIGSLGQVDAKAAFEDGYMRDTADLAAWNRARAKYYTNDGEIVEIGEHASVKRWIVLEPCGEPPHWWAPLPDVQAAIVDSIAAGRSLEERGADVRPVVEVDQIIKDFGIAGKKAAKLRRLALDADNEISDAKRDLELQKIAKQVRDQAGDNTFVLTLKDGREVQVPLAPFTHWALHRLPDIRKEALPEWTCVAPSGVKMELDNPYHTDWVLGAGLTIKEGYSDNVSYPAWDKAAELQIAEVDRD
jgi:hypothetical protein